MTKDKIYINYFSLIRYIRILSKNCIIVVSNRKKLIEVLKILNV